MTESDFTLTGYVHASPERFSKAGLYNVVARLIRATTIGGERHASGHRKTAPSQTNHSSNKGTP
jgi:hypothetical protein